MSSSKRPSIDKTAAKHSAVQATLASSGTLATSTASSSGPSQFVEQAKRHLKLQIVNLQLQLAVLEELEQLGDDEKLQQLFLILDKDHDGSVSAVELADGLRKIRGDVSFSESVQLAVRRIQEFDQDGDGKFSLEEFQAYIDTLCDTLGATFHELAELLIISVVFNEEIGNTVDEELVAALVQEDITEAIQEEEKLAKFMRDERMVALFHLFDDDMSGQVSFDQVVLGLYKITENVDQATAAAVTSMLLFDEDGNQSLDYKEFTKFILQLVQSMDIPYNEAIFNLTVAAAKDIDEDMTMTQLSKKLKEM
jgi:Ca2+-binding EF-hand superfamily protein